MKEIGYYIIISEVAKKKRESYGECWNYLSYEDKMNAILSEARFILGNTTDSDKLLDYYWEKYKDVILGEY